MIMTTTTTTTTTTTSSVSAWAVPKLSIVPTRRVLPTSRHSSYYLEHQRGRRFTNSNNGSNLRITNTPSSSSLSQLEMIPIDPADIIAMAMQHHISDHYNAIEMITTTTTNAASHTTTSIPSSSSTLDILSSSFSLSAAPSLYDSNSDTDTSSSALIKKKSIIAYIAATSGIRLSKSAYRATISSSRGGTVVKALLLPLLPSTVLY